MIYILHTSVYVFCLTCDRFLVLSIAHVSLIVARMQPYDSHMTSHDIVTQTFSTQQMFFYFLSVPSSLHSEAINSTTQPSYDPMTPTLPLIPPFPTASSFYLLHTVH